MALGFMRGAESRAQGRSGRGVTPRAAGLVSGRNRGARRGRAARPSGRARSHERREGSESGASDLRDRSKAVWERGLRGRRAAPLAHPKSRAVSVQEIADERAAPRPPLRSVLHRIKGWRSADGDGAAGREGSLTGVPALPHRSVRGEDTNCFRFKFHIFLPLNYKL